MKKVIIVAIVCFLIGGIAGYFLRPVISNSDDKQGLGGRPGFERQRPDAMPSGMPGRPGFRPDAMPSGAPEVPDGAGA